jgi:transcriptional regulator with XRE-family HTH domain
MQELTQSRDGIDAFSREVGARLRAVRRQRRLSLDDVERTSGGRWSASAVGAYERGFRNLSLPRLRDLADFYGVPMSVLLGEPTPSHLGPAAADKVVIDLAAVGDAAEAAPVAAFARSVVARRGDWNGSVLSIRGEDLCALAWAMDLDEPSLLGRLDSLGVLVGQSGELLPADDIDLAASV